MVASILSIVFSLFKSLDFIILFYWHDLYYYVTQFITNDAPEIVFIKSTMSSLIVLNVLIAFNVFEMLTAEDKKIQEKETLLVDSIRSECHKVYYYKKRIKHILGEHYNHSENAGIVLDNYLRNNS